MTNRDLLPHELADKPHRDRTHSGASVLGPFRGEWYGTCADCGWRTALSSDRQSVWDGVAAHRIFHHVTGSYLCGDGHCGADIVIKRIRQERGLPERARYEPQDPMRNFGAPPAHILGEYAEHVAGVLRSEGHR